MDTGIQPSPRVIIKVLSLVSILKMQLCQEYILPIQISQAMCLVVPTKRLCIKYIRSISMGLKYGCWFGRIWCIYWEIIYFTTLFSWTFSGLSWTSDMSGGGILAHSISTSSSISIIQNWIPTERPLPTIKYGNRMCVAAAVARFSCTWLHVLLQPMRRLSKQVNKKFMKFEV